MTLAQTIRDWLSPFLGDYEISTTYGAPAALGGGKHYGLDFRTPTGTPVYAPFDATVKRADSRDAGGGNIVELLDAATGDYSFLVAHLRNFVVKPGESVKAGELIGYTGSSGSLTTGPHAHVETRYRGQHVNPADLFDFLADVDPDAYSQEARRMPLQADGNCPVGYHRVNDGFFGVGGDMGGAYCEADTLPGAAVAGALDWTKGVALFFASILDPQNWLAWAALGGGAILTMYGLFMIWQTT